MSISKTVKRLLVAAMLVVGMPVLAAEMDHSQMSHDMSTAVSPKAGEKIVLQKLATVPASGKARESGYDDRYVMESTDAANALQDRCAQASRGLVMLNNDEWSRCGGKPDGAADTPLLLKDNKTSMDEHAGHKM